MAPYIHPECSNGVLTGMLNEATEHFGLVGTNIPFRWLAENDMVYGDKVHVTLENDGKTVLDEILPLEKSFGFVPLKAAFVFSSETSTVMLAKNQGNLVKDLGLDYGPSWKITLKKA